MSFPRKSVVIQGEKEQKVQHYITVTVLGKFLKRKQQFEHKFVNINHVGSLDLRVLHKQF
jgi:hypothetical protein